MGRGMEIMVQMDNLLLELEPLRKKRLNLQRRRRDKGNICDRVKTKMDSTRLKSGAEDILAMCHDGVGREREDRAKSKNNFYCS